ncbi:hypothetical protein [Streptomyces aureus]|uniref:hypothetical protein n=1 Tax=Streptomyces aureus TaxID=193461 RepID=UPI00131B0765|nr:hypothetical protein [Streptomyces aureus]
MSKLEPTTLLETGNSARCPHGSQFVAGAVAAVGSLAVGFFIQALLADTPPVLHCSGMPGRSAKP